MRSLPLLAFISCGAGSTDVSNAKTSPAIYDGPNKFWAHQVNDPAKAPSMLERFPGIELDVVFEDGVFDVRHNPDDDSSDTNLDDYFSQIASPENHYYWIDLKNLSLWNGSDARNRMAIILEKYNLEKNCIVESTNEDELSLFSEQGIATSYWIPHFEYDEGEPASAESKAREIAGVLSTYDFNAISCHYPMVAFTTHFFPELNVHIWTNGLDFETDREQIDAFADIDNIKVVLVDP